MTDHLKDPQAVSRGDLAEDFAFADAEQVAEAMGVTQVRVSRIEKGQLERSEVHALTAFVKALGGKLKIVAGFGDESYVLG